MVNGYVMEVASVMEENCHVTEVVTLMGGRMVMLQKSPVSWREHGHATEVVSLMEGERSCYRGGQFNGGRMVMLQR